MRLLAMTAVTLMMASVAQAQPSSGQPPAASDAPSAGPPSTAGMMGRGRGRGGMGMRAGAQNTYGWSMMTPEERQTHMTRMRGFTSRKDCEAYVAQHHQQMVERAKQRGVAMPAEPPRNPCAGLP